MERNLESIIEEIAQNEELSKEFMAMDEIDEIYAYCKEMGLNSSEEEFDEEVSSMIDNFDSNYSKIGDFELENVKIEYLSILEETYDNIDNIVENYIAADLLDLDDYETRCEMIKKVTIQDIINVSKKIHMDTIYLLKGDNNAKS